MGNTITKGTYASEETEERKITKKEKLEIRMP